MEIFLVRHAETIKGSGLVFGDEGAPLSESGRRRATGLRQSLAELGMRNIGSETAVVSPKLRARQTAEAAGLLTVGNPLLDEVNTSDPSKTSELLASGMLPPEAVLAGRALVSALPAMQHRVLVTHGLVMMGVREVCDLPVQAAFIPDYCEIMRVEI